MRRHALALALVACSAPVAQRPAPPTLAYAGSAACRPCHAAIYDRWKRTRMANVVRDPREHPDAIIPDLSKPDPLLTFGLADIAFVYGSKWKQRYFTRRGDDYVPLPAQWDVTHGVWKPYHVGDNTDWWVPFYGKDNRERPTGPLCDGCHSVGYDVRTKRPVEWNVGCERCHGPGADHVRAPSAANIIDPAKLSPQAENDVCLQCHTQGRPRAKLDGVYDWPVGYRVGLALDDFWQLEDHAPGATTFTHFADGTAHKNRMQGNDFVQAKMYRRGVTCASCHDVHGTANPADLVFPAVEVCTQCHDDGGPNGPRPGHTHHRAESAACVDCHMPKIAQTIGDVMVRSHTFRFVAPGEIPDACTLCHADRDKAWASAALAAWRR
jgi:predicted CXXCH cytochrome family protein